MGNICPNCKEEFFGIGTHWQMSDCPYPELTEKQYEAITGILMGDGTINRQTNSKPRFRVDNTNKEYLKYIDDILKPYSRGLKLVKESKDVAEHFQNSGFTEGVKEENCKDVYALWTSTSPVFQEFAEWYECSGKVFPKSINLSPTTLKHWFVCDGYCKKRGNCYSIGIQMANERYEKDKIEKLFSDGPGVDVSYWNERTQDGGYDYCCADFNVEESTELIEYMGNAIPGFKYKWPDD